MANRGERRAENGGGAHGAQFTRSFDLPRFDKGRWYIIRPDGSEKDIDPLTANAIADEWNDVRRAALIWYASRKD